MSHHTIKYNDDIHCLVINGTVTTDGIMVQYTAELNSMTILTVVRDVITILIRHADNQPLDTPLRDTLNERIDALVELKYTLYHGISLDNTETLNIL